MSLESFHMFAVKIKSTQTSIINVAIIQHFVLILQILCLIVQQHLCCSKSQYLCCLLFPTLTQVLQANRYLLSGCVSSMFVHLYARYCVLVRELGCQMKAKTGSKVNKPDLQRRKPFCWGEIKEEALRPLNSDSTNREVSIKTG